MRTPKEKWHRLTKIDTDAMVADCSRCGLANIYRVGPNNFVCSTARLEATRKVARNAHGLTREEAENYRNLIGCCEICGVEQHLTVDHNHETKQVRGILCNRCNRALYIFEDAELYEGMMAYLKYWEERK